MHQGIVLTVGTDSTWSLRAWICSQLAGMEVSVNVINLSKLNAKSYICELSPAGLVPILNDNDLNIHDSLAIAEYFNECSENTLFPKSKSQRAIARSLCAELHSGFMNLRSACPFSLNEVKPFDYGNENIDNELARVESIFKNATLPYMFESAGIVDAFYSVLAYRLKIYGIEFSGKAGEYQSSLLNWSLLNAALNQCQIWKNA